MPWPQSERRPAEESERALRQSWRARRFLEHLAVACRGQNAEELPYG